MDNLEPITRNEMFLNGDDLEPITREEMILAGADLEPITRHEWFLKKYRGGGGGGEYDLVNIPNLPADIASFNDGTDLPMASLKVAVTPYQDLSHGNPSPSNICPISGWSEANVGIVGKNLCGELEVGTFAESSSEGATYEQMKTANGARIRTKELIPTFNNNIVISCDFSSYQYCFCLYDADKKYLGEISGFASWKTSASTPSMPSSYIAVAIKRNDGAVVTSADLENCHLQVELGTTATTYSPYNGSTYTIDLDGTRYGGELDVVSGVLTVDRAYVDLGTLNWSMSSQTTHGFYARPLSDYVIGENVVILCSNYPFLGTRTNGFYEENKLTCYRRNNATSPSEFYIQDNEYSDVTAFKTAMNGVQLVYELATPITVQLAPQPARSIEGENNIFANCGQITEVKYFKKA